MTPEERDKTSNPIQSGALDSVDPLDRPFIRDIRQRLGLSQRAMADTLKTPRRTYEDWEADPKRTPNTALMSAQFIEFFKKGKVSEHSMIDRYVGSATRGPQ